MKIVIHTDSTHKRILGIVLFSILCLFNAEVEAQKYTWSPERREIEIELPDSTIRAYVSIQNIDLKTSDCLMYYWYDDDCINYNKGGYDGLLMDGIYRVYNKKRKLITKGHFSRGLKEGCWHYWNTHGEILNTQCYKKGLLNGESKTYAGGELINVKRYRNGELVTPLSERIKFEKKEKSATPEEEPTE